MAEYESPLSYQVRSMKIFHDGYVFNICKILINNIFSEGFALGSVEGRVAIEYFSEMNQKGMLHVHD